MNTEELEKNIKLLDNLFANDRLYDKLKDRSRNIIYPFRQELENNLLGKNKEIQTSLIRWYVAKLQVLQKNFSLSTEFLFNGSPDKYSQTGYLYTFRDGTRRALNEYEIYLYESHWVFIQLINELQRVCIINEIDFVKICNDLALSPIYINRLTTEDIFNDNISLEFNFNGDEVVPIILQETDNHINHPFEDYLIHPNKLKLIEELKKRTQGEKGKHIGIMILALEKCKMISYADRTSLYESIRSEFGVIGTGAGINKYITPYKEKTDNEKTISFKDSEIEMYSVFLRQI